MKTKKAVDNIKVHANDSNECCLNCRFSYFNEYTDKGMCHNRHMVEGNLFPKVVDELYFCMNWEKK